MLFIISLVLAFVVLLSFASQIKKRPWLSYAIITVVTTWLIGSYIFGLNGWWPNWFKEYFFQQFRRGSLSTAVFVIVMYLGIIGDKINGVARLRQIRGEMSIIGCILALGHIIYYGQYYFIYLFTAIDTLLPPHLVATIISIILLVIMLPLMITSFPMIRRRMEPRHWKMVQRWAYVFYSLLYIHIIIMIGSTIYYYIYDFGPKGIVSQEELREEVIENIITLVAYSIVFIPYFIIRPIKYFQDKHTMSSFSSK
jgi:DMSO/TMAO reductase YedYZ heme-binding membrane subunit